MKNKCKVRIMERALTHDVKEVANILRSGDPLRIARVKSEFDNYTILIKKDGTMREVPTFVLRWANKNKVIVEIPKKFLIAIADNQFGFNSFLEDKLGYLLQR